MKILKPIMTFALVAAVGLTTAAASFAATQNNTATKEAAAKSVKTETGKHKHRKHRIHHRIKRHKSHAAKMVGKTKLSKSVKQESY